MKATSRRIPVPAAPSADPALSAYCTSSTLLDQRLDGLLPPADMAPQVLHRAMRYAVLSGGKRLRPRLLIAVAAACGAQTSGAEASLIINTACAIEFLHCASLVHDDLPVFDDSPMRRGQPTVHIMFGEPIAILTGDALLSRAFEVIAESPQKLAHRALSLLRLFGVAAGSRQGLIGGQSLEQESPQLGGGKRAAASSSASSSSGALAFSPGLVERYHLMKSASMFRLAARAGALAAGSAKHRSWARVGEMLGLAFQLADDLGDVSSSAGALGKPVGRDDALGRPNAALVSGAAETRTKMESLVREATTLAAALSVEPSPLFGLLDKAGAGFGMTAA